MENGSNGFDRLYAYLAFLVAGLIIGMIFQVTFQERSIDIDYAVSLLTSFDDMFPYTLASQSLPDVFNENMTVREIKVLYLKYESISKPLLMRELKNICGG